MYPLNAWRMGVLNPLGLHVEICVEFFPLGDGIVLAVEHVIFLLVLMPIAQVADVPAPSPAGGKTGILPVPTK